MGSRANLNRKGLQGTVPAFPPFLADGRGNCADADPELFVTEGDWGRKRAVRVALARTYCTPCPLREACEEWATKTRQSGVWGGTTTEQRRVRETRRRHAGA